MNASNRTARTVGALFLLSNLTFLLGAVVFIESTLGSPDYLTLASANRTPLILGVLLEIVNAVAYVGIALLMFPILSRSFRSMAIGYVGIRIVEFVMQILGDLSPLALLTLSEEFASAGAPEAASFQAVGSLLLAERFWAFQMISITFGLGALMFYTMLYRTKLVPRFISVWGLVGAAIVLANTLLDMLGISLVNLGVIMLLNEVFLGVWLLVKGFNPDAITTETAEMRQAELKLAH